MTNSLQDKTLASLIEKELKPFVKKVDLEAFYAKTYLKKLGEKGYFSSRNKQVNEIISDEMNVVNETAKVCMTTAFCLWCHLAALTYVRNTENKALKQKLLRALESGEILGATGLSNPMKYYAGLETLHLSAEPVEGGYLVSGVLPSVSNLDDDHWFGIIANVNDNKRMMGIVSAKSKGLQLKEKVDYLGLNGSATYACSFKDVFVPYDQLLSEDADDFVNIIRPAFVAYQIPLGVGVSEASIDSIEKVNRRQNGCNRYLPVQSIDLQQTVNEIRKKIDYLFVDTELKWERVLQVRLDTVYLTLKAVQASMLHNGSAGYLNSSAPSRRLREAYFFANLTPTVKHLEKMLKN